MTSFASKAKAAGQKLDAVGSESALESISALVQRLGETARRVESLEAQLSSANEDKRRIEFDLLPEAMRAARTKSLTTEDGLVVTVEPMLSATLGKGKGESEEDHEARRAAAFVWLRKYDHIGIIKAAVSVQFDRGDTEAAQRAANLLTEAGIDAAVSEEVHSATLKKFVEEQLAADRESFPSTLFRVSESERATVKPPKKKRSS